MVGHLTEGERWSITHYEWQRTGNTAAMDGDPKFPSKYKRIKFWVDIYKKTGALSPRKPFGRPKLITVLAARAAVDMLTDTKKFGTSTIVAAELHKLGLTPGAKPVSKDTLIRAAVAQAAADEMSSRWNVVYLQKS